MKEFDWAAFVFDPQQSWTERLRRIASRRFPSEELAGEADNYALVKLSAGDWQLLAGFAGKSLPGSYLVTVYRRLLEDFSREKFGRRRPPAWLERLGQTTVRIFRMLCLERQERETIVDHLCARGQRDPDAVRSSIRMILARIPACGCRDFELRAFDPSQVEQKSISGATPERDCAENEFVCLLAALRELVRGEEIAAGVVEDRAGASMSFTRMPEFVAQVRLTDEERLILRARFQDSRTFAAIGRALDLPEHRIRRICNRALKRLRASLTTAGIGEEVLSSV